MIIIDRAKLRFLRAGRPLRLEVSRSYKVGHDYAAGIRAQHAVCRVRVLACAERGDGWEITVTQHREARPVYLAANPARPYTQNAAAAARDDAGPLEVADADWVRRSARHAFERDDQLRRDRVIADKRPSRRYALAPSLPRKTAAPALGLPAP